MTQSHYIDELGRPFVDGGQNAFGIFGDIADRYGVYIFVDESGGVLYVGKAHRQTLKDRITQNYTELDTGGTFKDNWCMHENRSFSEFKETLATWKVVTISSQTRDAEWIGPLEEKLIQALRPQYNRA